MAKKERTKEDVEIDLWWEKKEKKLLLICSAICCGLGLIVGLVVGITEGGSDIIFAGIFGGLWIGTGVGVFISYLPRIPHNLKQEVKEGGGCLAEGCSDIVINFLKTIAIGLIILSALGPIGLLIRFLWGKHEIKKLEKELSSFGQ